MNPSSIAQDELGPDFADVSDRFVAKGCVLLLMFCLGYAACEASHDGHVKRAAVEARR